MIRLIATDLDGTLLDDAKQLPADFYEVLGALRARGIAFAVVSGRSYSAARVPFGEAAPRMDFLCDNGAFCVEQGTPVFSSVIPRQLVEEADAAVLALGPRVRAVLCTAQGVWVRAHGAAPEFANRLSSYYNAQTLYDDMREVKGDVFKVAVCDLDGAGEHSYPVLSARFAGRLSAVWSGPYYMDLMNPGIDKGGALRWLQARLGVRRDETLAFGDYYNDIGLLGAAGTPVVTENAPADMRAHARFVAPPNAQAGVTRFIRSYVLGGQPARAGENL